MEQMVVLTIYEGNILRIRIDDMFTTHYINFLGCPVLKTLRQIIIFLYIWKPKFFCLSVF